MFNNIINRFKLKRYSMLILSCFNLLSTTNVFAAAPGMHIYTATLWLKQHPANVDEFLVGTLFPDIRFLHPISRYETHEKNIVLTDVLHAKSAFAAGMRLHVIVDKLESNFAKEYGIYALLPEMNDYDKKTLLKFIEDEIIWSKQDLSNIKLALKKFYQPELASGVPLIIIFRWHYALYQYFKYDPSKSIAKYTSINNTKAKLDETKVQLFLTLVPKLAQDPRFITYTEALITHISNKFHTT